MSFRIDTRNFKRQAATLMDVRRWPDARHFWARQARGVMREVIGNIPPSQGKADLAAKRRGEAAITGDIAKLFVGVAPSQAENVDLASIHRRARNSRGKVPRSLGDRRHKVSRVALRDYVREKSRSRPGHLAAGFNAGAAVAGYRPPAWIWRHQSPGSASLTVSERGIRFRATNAVRYASGVANLESRIQKGIDGQAAKIQREVIYLLEKAAAAAGFRTR